MVEPLLPGAYVWADSHRLMQVLTNLLSNAAKFSPAGSKVVIGTSYVENYVRISVTDQGPGIPEEFQLQIFQKFAQADSRDNRQKGGTGLGLSIAKSLIERMNGRISFNTKPGIGTSFFIDIPVYTNTI
jgi:signal transduction histidine kinase